MTITFRPRWTITAPPLIWAVGIGNKSIFKRILHKQRTNADCYDEGGRSALWWAAALGLDSYIKELLESQKMRRLDEIVYINLRLETSLSIAVRTGHQRIVAELLKHTKHLPTSNLS
ncbi:hypothetical protein F5Y11DRAFT_329926 [Daldinia sp. FL1419]|nr:hypothetical protein F5Y11DRAFT_329926 [Daldinia sp. FL1419]